MGMGGIALLVPVLLLLLLIAATTGSTTSIDAIPLHGRSFAAVSRSSRATAIRGGAILSATSKGRPRFGSKKVTVDQKSTASAVMSTTTSSHEDKEDTPRSAILMAGICLGHLTFLPNLAASDAGTHVALTACYMGMTASLLFVLGGLYGCIVSGQWTALLPALVCQVAMFYVWDAGLFWQRTFQGRL